MSEPRESESKESSRGATCAACGYANPAGTRSCGLCGGYLFGGGSQGGKEGRAESRAERAVRAAPRIRLSPGASVEASDPPTTVADASELRELLQPRSSAADIYGKPSGASEPALALPPPPAADLEVGRALPRFALAGPPPGDPHASPRGLANAAAPLRRQRRRRVWKHGLTSAALAFAIYLVAAWVSGQPLERLWTDGVRALVFGFPVGLCVSRVNGGPLQGLRIGALFGVLSLGLAAAAALASNAAAPGPLELALSLAGGIAPGVLIGFEVQNDT